jgi:hypothetical protein
MTATDDTSPSGGRDPFDHEYQPSPVPRIRDQVALLHLRAREVFGTEKQHWWVVAERFWPHYPEYRELAAGREIPLVVLEPVGR